MFDKELNGILHIQLTNNNVIICCSDRRGNTVLWSSAGERGFKGKKKSSPFAIQVTMEMVLKKLITINIKHIQVEIKGIESNRDVVLRVLQSSILNITSIRDIVTKSHNGCKPPKVRRV
ncbi:30S ribosomal protein S11 [Candidatus Hodgkinia cicadicola]|uniref:Small ribosomal subunit protein uS11 n=1 Tax=Candidatus Hodgkinia cicadicola TaxID=573658 RepID=A0ABX4MEL9_9HYPH|nr:30S ribosomal protein S11 [Candidatus Hodgkinia cicadicola]PIM95248.1 30S ribosomal protein S11 [Candidatus Hodgkinia cicadicola]